MEPSTEPDAAPLGSIPDTRAPRVGQRVGPFQLTARHDLFSDIGLYDAERPAGSRSPRTVAIRIAEDPRNDRAAAWVRHEYDVLRRLDDPRIPRAHGYYSSQVGAAFTPVFGPTLADALRLRARGRLRLDAPTMLDLLVEVAEVLRHAHSVTGPDGPIHHGHLQPSSVAFDTSGRLFVLGFGAPSRPAPVGYSPPEEVAGAFVDARSDQWRLGALAIELILGQPLYAAVDDPAEAAVEGRVGPWLARVERRAPALIRPLTRLLAPAAGGRYADENTLVRDILEATRTHGGQADRPGFLSRLRSLVTASQRAAGVSAAAAAPPQPVSPHPAPIDDAPPTDPSPVRQPPEPAPAPKPEPDPEPEPVPPPQREPVVATPTEPEPEPEIAVVAVEVDDDSLFSEAPPPVAAVVPTEDPASVPGPALPVHPVAAPVPDPGEVAVVTPENDDDDISLGLDRLGPSQDGPVLGSPAWADAADDPLAPVGPTVDGGDSSPGLLVDPSDEVTEVIPEPRPQGERPEPIPAPVRREPGRWFPSELAAVAAIGVLVVVAIRFLMVRFG